MFVYGIQCPVNVIASLPPGIVDADQHGENVGLQADRIRFHPGIEIDNAISADAAIVNGQVVTRAVGQQLCGGHAGIAGTQSVPAMA